MDVLIAAAFRAIRSLFAPGMFATFIFSVILTIAALAGFFFISSAFFIWLGEHLHHGFISLAGTFGSGLLAWFLFPGIMPVIISFFDTRIVAIIERNDYPLAAAHASQFWSELWHDTRFAFFILVLNIAVLPLYLIPVLNLCLFYLLNGYLLGREFFVMSARRHRPAQEAEILRKRHAGIILTGGIVLTLLATIPIVNLIAPFWGVALMTHLYHKLTAAKEADILSPR